jgi:hypothetical protein
MHVITTFVFLHAPKINTRYVTPIIALPSQISNVSAYKNITEREAAQAGAVSEGSVSKLVAQSRRDPREELRFEAKTAVLSLVEPPNL